MEENNAALQDIAAQLATKLRVQGGGGREAWSTLQGKLAEIAAASTSSDPRTAVQALMNVARDASSPQALMRTLQKRVDQYVLKYFVCLVAGELKMTPLGDSEPVQMVDEDSEFCEGNVDRIIKWSTELSALHAPYAVISIVGAQSSGKSYLLNRLFGTRFPEMQAQYGRGRTTKGIMMSRCIGPSLILLDVEGSDGVEKGEDTLFEKRATLFALTVSDLMMVNMSLHDIGRDQGSCTPIFQTIFQERLKLPQGFTKILFVVRYYDGETPLGRLRTDLQETLEKIWERVHGRSVKLKDYIEVHVVALPDKKSPEFPKEVTILRKLLSNNRSGKVPACSFLDSSKLYWDDIKKNKALDIPSHQVNIARLYCQRLVQYTLSSLISRKDYKLLKAEESPSGFRQKSDELLKIIKNKYDLDTKMLVRGVRDKEGECLVEKLYMIFTDDAKEIISKMKENTLERSKGDFDRNIQNIRIKYTDSYGELIVSECMENFLSSCEDLKVFGPDNLRRTCRKLEQNIRSYTTIQIQEIKREHRKKKRRMIISGAIAAGVLTIKLSIFAVTGIPPLY